MRPPPLTTAIATRKSHTWEFLMRLPPLRYRLAALLGICAAIIGSHLLTSERLSVNARR